MRPESWRIVGAVVINYVAIVPYFHSYLID